jgi:hypothetical protein
VRKFRQSDAAHGQGPGPLGAGPYRSPVPQDRRTDDLAALARSLRRVDDRVRRWSPSRWAAAGSAGRSRSDCAHDLAVTLAALGRLAGNGAPSQAPPEVQPYAIADQLLVLGQELANAPQAAAHAEAGTAAVERFLAGL